eukprot:6076443-Lingulodinium_polyedra.AAC.1
MVRSSRSRPQRASRWPRAGSAMARAGGLPALTIAARRVGVAALGIGRGARVVLWSPNNSLQPYRPEA